MPLRDPDQLQKAACCLLAAAAQILEGHGLTVPEKQVPSHKGLDDHCENCESMWASIGPSSPAEATFGEECAGMRAWTFQLDLLRQVCTEKAGLGDDCNGGYGGCQGCGDNDPTDPDGPADDPDDRPERCCDPIPVEPEPRPCTDDPPPTVAEESARFWRERFAIEKQIEKAFECCLEECHRIRCRGVQMGVVTEATEGGCHYLTVELTAVF